MGPKPRARVVQVCTQAGSMPWAIRSTQKLHLSIFLAGGWKRGAIYAAYALLEEDLGCRWYDRWSSRMPEGRTLQVAAVPRSFVPPLFIRDPFYFDAFDPTWSLRNRTNSPQARVPREWGGHVDYDGLFVHTYNTLVPPGQYWDRHPEYFMQAPDGRRSQQQVCQTHPQVRQIATASLLAILERHPDTQVVEVSPNDGGQHCCCPACKAIDDANGSPSGSLLDFVNHIAAAVEKVRPDLLVSTLAYLDTVDRRGKWGKADRRMVGITAMLSSRVTVAGRSETRRRCTARGMGAAP